MASSNKAEVAVFLELLLFRDPANVGSVTSEPWLAVFLHPWPHTPVREAGKRAQCLDNEEVGLVKSKEPWLAIFLNHFS